MKKLFLLFTSFLFLSCNFYISDGNCDDVTKKTEIKDIAECTDPIVITMPVYDELDLFGNSKLGSRYECLGDIFVVIDTQTNDLFDWVFCPNKEGSVLWRCVELGTNPKKYFSSCGTLQCCIQAGSTKVHRFKTDCRGRYMENYSSPGTKGLLIGYKYDDEAESLRYLIKSFDSETGNVTDDFYILCDDPANIYHPIADEYGNFYSADGDIEKSCIYKIDPYDCKVSSYYYDFPKTKMKDGIEKQYNHFVMAVHNNQILLTSYQLGVISKETDVILLDLDKQNVSESMKKISCPSEYYENCDSVFFYEGMYYKGLFYSVLVCNSGFYIMKLNFENETLEDISGLIDFDMTENIWVRGTRVYFMRSRNTQKVTFMYFDLETREKSEVFALNYEDVILR